MFEMKKRPFKIISIFLFVFLIYLSFWFLLNNLKTNGIWETVILSVLFFWFLPKIIFKDGEQKEEKMDLTNKKKLIFKTQVVGIWLIFAGLVFNLKGFTFLKLNYLARTDWYLNDWWLLWFLNLILLPLVLYSQELFFRKFLFQRLKNYFSIKKVVIIQAIVFVLFESLFFGIFVWQFILFNFVLALILGYFYYKTRTVWCSFFVRWGLILILEGFILNKIQQLKF